MRSVLLFLAPLFAVVPLTSCGSHPAIQKLGSFTFDRTGEKAERVAAEPFDGGLAAIELDHRFGDVRVLAGDEGSAPGYEWRLTCWGTTREDAERHCAEIRLEHEVREGAHRLTLVLPEEQERTLRGIESKLTVRVPPSVEVSIRNSFGDSEVRGISGLVTGRCAHGAAILADLGPVDFETSFDDLTAERIGGGRLKNSHGAIRATDVRGDLSAETSFGELRIARVSGELKASNAHGDLIVEAVDGPLHATTSFADLRAEQVVSNSVLENSHGSIHARALEGEVRAETSFAGLDLETRGDQVWAANSHGDISITCAGGDLRRIEAETNFGDLSLELPPEVRPAIFLDHRYGDVKCPYPVILDRSVPDLAPGVPEARLKVRHGDITVAGG